MLTFGRCFYVRTMMLIITLTGTTSKTYYEGNTCQLSPGKLGVCTKLPECKSIDNGLKGKKISFGSLVQCSFAGSTLVICCPDRMPQPELSTTKRPRGEGQIVFIDSSDDDTKTISANRGNVRKCETACAKFTNRLSPDLDFQIVGGEPTKPGEFPHMAGIGYRTFDTDELTWDCGGSLISERFILTAAHCVENPNRQPKIIRLGKRTVRNNDDGEEAVDVKITKISLHPDYRSSAKYHDIAIIQLENDVEFNKNVAPACLYTSNSDLDPSTQVVATGWGTEDVAKRRQSNFMLKVNLTTTELNICNQSYSDYGFSRQYSDGIQRGQLCASDPEQNKDSCQGDSGGPLQIVNDTLHLSTIVGITSFGIGCASEIPSVYTRVAFYLDWIESIVWP